MSHYLFALRDGGGNIPPMMGLVRSLGDRGHAVTVLGDPTLGGDAFAAGARFQPWDKAPHRTSDDPTDVLVRDWEFRTPVRVLRSIRDEIVCGPAQAYADDLQAQLDRVPTDAVVADMMLFGAQIRAEASGLPWATVMTNVYAFPAPGLPPFGPGLMPAKGRPGRLRDRALLGLAGRFWRPGLAPLNAARQTAGLDEIAQPFDQPLRADRVLVLTTRAFDFPGVLPDHVRYVGPQLAEPRWVDEWRPPEGDEPLVLVGLSTTFQDQQALLQRIVDALGRLPVRGLVTTGPAVDPQALRAGERVEVVRGVSHDVALDRADLVVTHAGHGTVIRALARGVPLVCIPMGRDQADTAARVVARGAGVRLPARASVARIATAVGRVLADPTYRANAGKLAEAIRADLAAARAIPELEDLVADDRS